MCCCSIRIVFLPLFREQWPSGCCKCVELGQKSSKMQVGDNSLRFLQSRRGKEKNDVEWTNCVFSTWVIVGMGKIKARQTDREKRLQKCHWPGREEWVILLINLWISGSPFLRSSFIHSFVFKAYYYLKSTTMIVSTMYNLWTFHIFLFLDDSLLHNSNDSWLIIVWSQRRRRWSRVDFGGVV